MLQDALGKVSGGTDLTMGEMAAVFDLIMQGKCSDEQIGLLLIALRTKGETVAEVAGAASAMRKHMTPIRCQHATFVDTCGTGGDGSGTFNISTAAAIVTAAAGLPVAKHGNRKITSRTGSADVLIELGVNVEAPVPVVEQCLNEVGIGFCFAPQLHPAMKHVAAVRKKLEVPTVFNLLGPVCNPAAAPFQVLGVGKPHLRGLLAEALGMLGTTRSVVVSGDDGLDEVSLAGRTQVTVVSAEQLQQTEWYPNDFGVTAAGCESMQASDPEASANIIRQVLAGKAGAARDIVVINAAAALWTAEQRPSLAECAQAAGQAIDNGAARDLLARLAKVSQG